MIVPTMTDAEIMQEVKKDFPELGKFTEYKDKEYRRSVLKARKFPFTMLFKKTTKSKNNWLVIYEARDKKDRHDSRIHFVCVSNSKNGLWCIMPSFMHDQLHLIFFQPHFFSRYKERMKLEITGLELIYQYFSNNYDYVYELTTKQISETEYVQECFGSCKEGIALGVVTTENNIFFKTFITHNMSKGQQIETFGQNEILRKEMNKNN